MPSLIWKNYSLPVTYAYWDNLDICMSVIKMSARLSLVSTSPLNALLQSRSCLQESRSGDYPDHTATRTQFLETGKRNLSDNSPSPL